MLAECALVIMVVQLLLLLLLWCILYPCMWLLGLLAGPMFKLGEILPPQDAWRTVF